MVDGEKVPARNAPFEALGAFCLLAAVAAVYGQVRFHGFDSFDTPVYLTQNVIVRSGLSAEGIRWAFTTFESGNWHPLTWLSLMSEVELFGLDPGAHHLTSVGLHAASSVLLLFFSVRATRMFWPSLLAATLFALHPMHVEPVAWAAQRKDVLSTFFLMATLIAYRSHAARPSPLRLSAAVALFGLGLLSKPMLVTVPLLLLALDFWPLGRWRRDRVLALAVEKLPFLLLAVAIALATLVAQHSVGAVGDLERYPLGLRFANAIVAIGIYLRKTVWPSDLAIFYPHPGHVPLVQWAACALALVGATGWAWRVRLRQPWLWTGWIWFLVALLPVIGIVQVGRQALADRYSYVPHVGLFIALAFALADCVRKRPGLRMPIGVAAAAGVIALAVVGHRQVGTWRDSEAIFAHALAVTRDNALAHSHLATALLGRGEFEAALSHFREISRIEPQSWRSRYHEAVVLARIGRDDEARAALELALERRPDDAPSHALLGVLEERRGDLERALAHLERAAVLEPAAANHAISAASILIDLGRLDEAEAQLERAFALAPDHPFAWSNRSRLLERSGRHAQAEEALVRALASGQAIPGSAERLERLRHRMEKEGEWTDRAERARSPERPDRTP